MASDWFLSELDDDGSVVREFKLHPPACTLGRSDENSLVLDRESVSSTHAKFSLDPDGDWWIEDLHSTNGIWKGEEELKGLHRLTPGEVLEIGTVKVRVERRNGPARPFRPAPLPDASGRIHMDDEGQVEDVPPDTGEPIVIEAYEDLEA